MAHRPDPNVKKNRRRTLRPARHASSAAAGNPKADNRTGEGSPADIAEARNRLSSLMVGNFVNQIFYVAARLGIPDLLARGPKTVAQLARATESHPRALAGLMRAMVALDAFAQDGGGRLRLRPMGSLLRSYPGWRSQVLLLGEEYFRCSSELLHTIKTGEPAFNHVFGASFYDYLARNRETAARFNEVMSLSAANRYADVPNAYDFSRASTIVDVGGGYGALTALLLKAYPGLRAVLFDSPRAIEGARKYIAQQGLADRCELVAGNFFESVPARGDIYLLSSVVVNWDDDRARALLGNCRRAMGDRTELVIIDQSFPDGRPPSPTAAVIAVAAHAVQGSIVRTEKDYRTLLGQAGFKLTRLRPLKQEPLVMICARPV
ncbi:MAG TPA: methyltransferase [Candidatus Binataceae bacterium]|nr:methyltransferase [Candidatus Binataceae bacterium]